MMNGPRDEISDEDASLSSSGDEGETGVDLRPEQTDQLLQLQSITGIEDLDVCRAMLDDKRWNLEAAVREHLGETPNRHNNDTSNRDLNRPLPQVPTAPNAHNHRAGHVVNRRDGGGGLFWTVFSWGAYFAFMPIRVPYRILMTFVNGLYGVGVALFGFPQRPGGNGMRGRAQLGFDPVAEVRSFGEEFDRDYGTSHPPFAIMSYAQAIDVAKKELRFMVVYLHSASHQDTRAFCARSLCSESVNNFFQEHNLLLWACSVESNEGHRVTQAMRESTYPFLAMIVLRQGKMMIVGRIEGAVLQPQVLTDRMEKIIRDNEAYVVAERAERAEREMNQSIREEQDRAFQETLRLDQERERKKKEEEDRKKAEVEEAFRLVQEEQDRKERIRRLKIDLADQIPDEPPKDDPGSIRVLVKLPEGQRLERRFLQTHSLKCLYYYVFCHPESPDEFDITTNFPRKVLPCKPEEASGAGDPPTFADEGISGSVMLFVNDLEA